MVSLRRAGVAAQVVLLACLLGGCAHDQLMAMPQHPPVVTGPEIPAEQPSPPAPQPERPATPAAPPQADATNAIQPVIFPGEISSSEPTTLPTGVCCNLNDCRDVWGVIDLHAFPYGDHIASNGVEFHQLFSLDLDFNIMLWRQHNLYAFADASFWGQRAAPGITNSRQGAFDFSKREFDLAGGLAWNYYGAWEFRAFAYSFNNLNRGNSQVSPSGFNDGVGVENRYYLGPTYEYLGTRAYDPARANFLSIGYFPTKSMVDPTGEQFRPGPFVRAYLTKDLWGPKCYLYGDFELIAARTFDTELLNIDVGVAFRPFERIPRLEFRLGSEDSIKLQGWEGEYSAYVGIHYIY